MTRRTKASICRIALAALVLLSPAQQLVPAAPSDAPADVLWPVNLGNEWVYQYEGGRSDRVVRMKVTGTKMGWLKLEGPWGDHWWSMSPDTGKVWVWDEESKDRRMVFDLGVRPGKTFTAEADALHCLGRVTYQLVRTDASVETPAGTFDRCRVIRAVSSDCFDAGIVSITFAPEVGIVQYVERSFGGFRTATLREAVVDGTAYPLKGTQPGATTRSELPSGLQVTLTIDRYVYRLTENRMPRVPSGDPTLGPAILRAALAVENGTTDTVPFTYPTSQTHEFLILDESGAKVRRWTPGDAFLQVVTHENLEPGNVRGFDAEIELVDDRGNPLVPGRYSIVGNHTTMPVGLRLAGKAAFRIDLPAVD